MHSEHTPVGDAHHAGAGHATLADYVKGFVLSILLTVVPFALVMHPAWPRVCIISTVVLLALVQIVVHLVYFLHMGRKSGQAWNTLAFAFTVMVVFLLVGGSIWIMASLYGGMTLPAAVSAPAMSM